MQQTFRQSITLHNTNTAINPFPLDKSGWNRYNVTCRYSFRCCVECPTHSAYPQARVPFWPEEPASIILVSSILSLKFSFVKNNVLKCTTNTKTNKSTNPKKSTSKFIHEIGGALVENECFQPFISNDIVNLSLDGPVLSM